MALSTQDFLKGLDFTGFLSASAADHNQLVDLAEPFGDTTTEGKGIVLWTADTALGLPSVPDATNNAKWARYVWIRKPHVDAGNVPAIAYVWNADATSDATYLKWHEVGSDITAVNAAIAALQVDLATVETTANNANNAASTANANAAAALAASTAATTTANAANVNATTALTNVDAAAAAALAANTLAVAAGTAATAAQNTANTALAAATAIKTKYARVSEQQASGTDAQPDPPSAGNNIRQLNVEDTDVSNLVTLSAGKIIFATAGDYRINAYSVASNVDHKLKVVLDATNAVLIDGNSCANASGTNAISAAAGIITLVAPNLTIRLDDWLAGATARGLGRKVTSGSVEVYAVCEIEKLA